MRTEMTCWSKKRMLRRPICLSILSCLVVLGLIGGAGYALGATSLKDGKLALSLPEVVIESPDIERLIAQRVLNNDNVILAQRLLYRWREGLVRAMALHV